MDLGPEQRGRVRTSFGIFAHHARTQVRLYNKLNLKAKLLVWALPSFYMALGVFFLIVGPSEVGQFTYDITQKLSNMSFGWLIIGGVITVVCFPPSIGHTTMITLCGFAYGMHGCWLAVGASVVGSALAFVVLRVLFAKRLRRWTSKNEKWTALEAVIRTKGLPLIILIRLSPFPPWVYANTLFASIESVYLWQFIIATACNAPKWILYVFIGSRLASLSDGEQRHHMSTETVIIDACLIVGGLFIGVIASVVVYRLVQRQLRNTKGGSSGIAEMAVESLEDSEEAPLLLDLSSDSINDPSQEHQQLLDV